LGEGLRILFTDFPLKVRRVLSKREGRQAAVSARVFFRNEREGGDAPGENRQGGNSIQGESAPSGNRDCFQSLDKGEVDGLRRDDNEKRKIQKEEFAYRGSINRLGEKIKEPSQGSLQWGKDELACEGVHNQHKVTGRTNTWGNDTRGWSAPGVLRDRKGLTGEGENREISKGPLLHPLLREGPR